MTDKEGIALLNQLADKLLNQDKKPRGWICKECNTNVRTKYLKGRHERVGHGLSTRR